MSPPSRPPGALNAYRRSRRRTRRCEMAKASDARRAQAARPGRWTARRWASRTCSAPRACAPPPARTILGEFKPTYESTVTANLWRDGRGDAGQAQHGRVRHGLVQRDLGLRPGGQSLARARAATPTLTPGGSSGGSAAAVAARAVPGRDGHRHRRLDPPARGLHRHGRHQADLRPLLALGHRRLRLVAGPGRADGEHRRGRGDPADVHGRPRPEGLHQPDRSRCRTSRASCGKSVKGLRIGVPKEYRVDGMPAEIEALWEQGIAWLKEAGCEIVESRLPHTKYALPAYYIVAPAEASSNLARYDGMRYGLRVDGANLTETYEKTRAAGLRRRGEAPHPDRHLCALGRLLRRLLPEGAEGAPPHRRRLRPGLRRRSTPC